MDLGRYSRFRCPLTHACLPGTPERLRTTARNLLTMGALYRLYAEMGGMIQGQDIFVFGDGGPHEVAWTLWGPMPIPCREDTS